jgi:hypothetical protein
MRATDVVRERALALAAAGRDDDSAVEELAEAALGKRIALVMARQELQTTAEGHAENAAAASLLDRAVSSRPWPDAVSE